MKFVQNNPNPIVNFKQRSTNQQTQTPQNIPHQPPTTDQETIMI
jgi:hypothetical protein